MRIDGFVDNVYVESKGTRYLDMLSGAGAYFLWKYGDSFWKDFQEENLNSTNFYSNEFKEKLIEELKIMSGFPNVFLLCSGSEANDAAIKLSLKYHFDKGVDRKKILYCEGCYFGRTMGAAYCSQDNYNEFLPENENFVSFRVNDFDDFCFKMGNGNDVSAVILEYLPSRHLGLWDTDTIYRIYDMCADNDANVIVDEIKAGFGRTGNIFSFYEWSKEFGFCPDIVTFGKSISAGFPLSGVLSSNKFVEVMDYRWHSSTYGGNPLICKVSSRLLGLLNLESLQDIYNESEIMHKGLVKLYEEKKITRAGKWWNIFVDDAKGFSNRLLGKKILVYNINDSNISLLPSMWFTLNHWDIFLGKFKEVLNEVG